MHENNELIKQCWTKSDTHQDIEEYADTLATNILDKKDFNFWYILLIIMDWQN